MRRLLQAIVCLAAAAALAQETPRSGPAPEKSAEYVLGPGDQIIVRVLNLEEVPNTPFVVDLNGSIGLPMIGRVPVAGMTTSQVERDLAKRYTEYLLHPDVSVSVVGFQSQPVSVVGAVRTPGLQQVQGRRTVVEMLSLAGGLAENAGSRLKLTRQPEWGPIPLPGASTDLASGSSVAEINLKSLLDAKNPQENIMIQPHDVISVPAADTVYVIGYVTKAGGFIVNQDEKMSVLQALSMAGGLDRLAQPKNARLLRRVEPGAPRTEIAVNLKDILDGKSPDVQMHPEDILFVPNNVPKSAFLRSLDVAIQMGTGVVIWR